MTDGTGFVHDYLPVKIHGPVGMSRLEMQPVANPDLVPRQSDERVFF